jgi:hypothetical protein
MNEVRWMVLNNRRQEAEQALITMAAVNNRALSEDDIFEIRHILDIMAEVIYYLTDTCFA